MTHPDQFDVDDLDDNEGEPQRQQRESKDIRALRAKAKRVDELEAENTLLRRGKAFRDAGIDTKSKIGSLFAKAYDGDLDADAIRREAAEHGLVTLDPEDDPDNDREAYERVSTAHQEGRTTAAGNLTPADVSEWDRDKRQRFRKQHPDAWRDLMAGNSVSGITF